MRRAARVDENQKRIVQCLRSMGASVLSLASVGHGVPDLLVGTPRGNWLIEIKNGKKPPSARTLTGDQKDFHCLWPGPIDVINSEDEAIAWLQDVRRRGL